MTVFNLLKNSISIADIVRVLLVHVLDRGRMKFFSAIFTIIVATVFLASGLTMGVGSEIGASDAAIPEQLAILALTIPEDIVKAMFRINVATDFYFTWLARIYFAAFSTVFLYRLVRVVMFRIRSFETIYRALLLCLGFIFAKFILLM